MLGGRMARVGRRSTTTLLWLGCLAPLAVLGWDATHGGLGANPITEATHRTGRWALILLLVTLAFTPVRRLTGWNGAIRWRRTVGLFAFFYAALHFAIYVVLDYFFDWALIVEDIAERPYVTVGFTAFLLLVPLAATSNRFSIRRLGKRWQRLHRLVYIATALAVLHFLWLVKAPDIGRPLRYGAVLALLLAVRVPALSKRLPAVKRGLAAVAARVHGRCERTASSRPDASRAGDRRSG
ncbi:MAG TPA: protein-methionine-sulfoxide reductase heme-binding subunit MsrQ [Longimicrobiales bacterium]